MPRKYILKLFISLTLLNVGCVQDSRESKPQLKVIIDSINDGTVANSMGLKYIILSGIKGINSDDLQFKEYSTYVDRALSSCGLIKSNSFDDSEIAIFCYYSISDPSEHQYSYSSPVFGQTGVSSSNTYGTVNSYGGSYKYSGTTVYNPTYGITGYTQRTESYVTYRRFIALSAKSIMEYKKSGKEELKWETKIFSTGNNGDLRRVFPAMIAAAVPYIGSNTGQKIEINIFEDDQSVLTIKHGSGQKYAQQGEAPYPATSAVSASQPSIVPGQ